MTNPESTSGVAPQTPTSMILKLLTADRLTIEDAEALLKFLGDVVVTENETSVVEVLQAFEDQKIEMSEMLRLLDAVKTGAGDVKRKNDVPKFLRIEINDAEDNVDLRIPLPLLRLGLQIPNMLPDSAKSSLESSGMDFSALQSLPEKDFADVVKDLSIGINDSDSSVSIYCE